MATKDIKFKLEPLDPQCDDVVYLQIREGKQSECQQVMGTGSDMVIFDRDKDGNILGIEVIRGGIRKSPRKKK